jgi:hypothetical protein
MGVETFMFGVCVGGAENVEYESISTRTSHL